MNDKEIALRISGKLEYLIKTQGTKCSDIASFIGVHNANFSRMRCALKRGKLPTAKFLIGISKFYNENFLF